MKIPSVHTVLWDIRADKVAILPQSFVIQGVLSYGSVFLVVETIKKMGIDVVRKAFDAMKVTAMSERRYRYLKTYLFS